MTKRARRHAWLVALWGAAFGFGCTDTRQTQVLTGRIDTTGVVAIRAVSGDDVVTAAQVTSDGSFRIALPSGARYRLEVLTSSGVKQVIAHRSGAWSTLQMKVCAPQEPFGIIVEEPAVPAVTTLEPAPTIVTKTSKTEQHFQRGWALLRDGHAAEAAVELGAAADADERDPLAVDARYFQAVALVRSGRNADAERVLVAFLDRAPTSLRRGRAAILLGKLLRDRGDAKSARAWFESALTDGDPAIAAAAKAHLDALSPRR